MWRALICVVWCLAAPAAADPLRILTSFPESFFRPFVEAFAEHAPEVDVQVQNKNTNSGLDEILRGNPRAFDIYWVSSPEAFAVLDAAQGGSALQGRADVFALAGVGWTYRDGMVSPKTWDDLLDPAYQGRLAMARPARSGTNHMFVEQQLQTRGWEDGWGFLLEFAANLNAITPRSFTVVEGVADGRFDFGVTIDFLARSDTLPGLRFNYGAKPLITGARIGILNGGGNPEAAAQFLAFVLSQEGQRILTRPDIRRIPIDPEIRAKVMDLPASFDTGTSTYDSSASAARYWAINALFDIFITIPLEQRKHLWQRIRGLEEWGAETDLIRARLRQLPVTEADAQLDPDMPQTGTRFTSLSPLQNELMARWTRMAEEQLAQIEAEITALEDTRPE